tara:strand:+ start:432 stop:692 length:261 start_codon:yes stop_codon:yes gene_type:complete
LIKLWYKWFHKKEKNMSTNTGESRTNIKLNKELKSQATEIGKLRGRINDLVDNIAVLESDIGIFKKTVSKDLLEVIEALKQKQTKR